MSELSNSVFDHYSKYLFQLPKHRQLHFASRLYLWNRHPGMKEVLDDLRPWFTSEGNVEKALEQAKWWGAHNPDFGSRNALRFREPYFKQYPKLTEYIPVLLKIMYLHTVYGIEAQKEFNTLFQTIEVRFTAKRLLADDKAIAMLSSQAINFLYTWSELDASSRRLLKPARFLEIGKQCYDMNDKLQLQLLIYLYTHCIIGATYFYYRAIPHDPSYQEMILELEQIVSDNYDNINLDNKFEFLVCARILGHQSSLFDRINDEAEQSVSSDGMFLIDRKNSNPQGKNTSFERSEHRNVLFLLSQTPYRPITQE